MAQIPPYVPIVSGDDLIAFSEGLERNKLRRLEERRLLHSIARSETEIGLLREEGRRKGERWLQEQEDRTQLKKAEQAVFARRDAAISQRLQKAATIKNNDYEKGKILGEAEGLLGIREDAGEAEQMMVAKYLATDNGRMLADTVTRESSIPHILLYDVDPKTGEFVKDENGNRTAKTYSLADIQRLVETDYAVAQHVYDQASRSEKDELLASHGWVADENGKLYTKEKSQNLLAQRAARLRRSSLPPHRRIFREFQEELEFNRQEIIHSIVDSSNGKVSLYDANELVNNASASMEASSGQPLLAHYLGVQWSRVLGRKLVPDLSQSEINNLSDLQAEIDKITGRDLERKEQRLDVKAKQLRNEGLINLKKAQERLGRVRKEILDTISAQALDNIEDRIDSKYVELAGIKPIEQRELYETKASMLVRPEKHRYADMNLSHECLDKASLIGDLIQSGEIKPYKVPYARKKASDLRWKAAYYFYDSKIFDQPYDFGPNLQPAIDFWTGRISYGEYKKKAPSTVIPRPLATAKALASNVKTAAGFAADFLTGRKSLMEFLSAYMGSPIASILSNPFSTRGKDLLMKRMPERIKAEIATMENLRSSGYEAAENVDTDQLSEVSSKLSIVLHDWFSLLTNQEKEAKRSEAISKVKREEMDKVFEDAKMDVEIATAMAGGGGPTQIEYIRNDTVAERMNAETRRRIEDRKQREAGIMPDFMTEDGLARYIKENDPAAADMTIQEIKNHPDFAKSKSNFGL
jgi:hypothetical protein